MSLIGHHINYIILFQVEIGRFEQGLVSQVETVIDALTVLLAYQQYIGTLAIDGQVAGRTNGIEYRHPLGLYLDLTRILHLAQHHNLEIHKLDQHKGVFQLGTYLILDIIGQLGTSETGRMNTPDNREIDIAFAAHGIYLQVGNNGEFLLPGLGVGNRRQIIGRCRIGDYRRNRNGEHIVGGYAQFIIAHIDLTAHLFDIQIFEIRCFVGSA